MVRKMDTGCEMIISIKTSYLAMKLIDLRKEGRTAAVHFHGYGLRYAYCTYRMQERKEHSVEQVMEFLLDPKVEEVYLGGDEPFLQE